MENTTLKFELCSPGRELVEYEIREAVIPGESGVFTVYPGHTPTLSTLIPGVLTIRDASDAEHFFAVHGGFVEVREDAIRILADTFEAQEDIDKERAEADLEQARELLRRPADSIEFARAEVALARATARLRASARHSYH
ncbi:MAG: ATP synthase F1 subunit epsilon [Candidatus Hydrogenedentes bacterium]|nr:ATP synthase F1 subunit epsilon [Candidatus Hydrogenedentota bacterium]